MSAVTWGSSNLMMCFFCLKEEARISVTRKGLPTLYCDACRTRTFIHRPDKALAGIRLLAPEILDMLAGRNPEQLQAEAAALMAGVLSPSQAQE